MAKISKEEDRDLIKAIHIKQESGITGTKELAEKLGISPARVAALRQMSATTGGPGSLRPDGLHDIRLRRNGPSLTRNNVSMIGGSSSCQKSSLLLYCIQ